MTNVYELESLAGTHITKACRELVEVLKTGRYEKAFMIFNGIKLVAVPGVQAGELVEEFNRKIKGQHKAYKRSKARKASQRKDKMELKQKRQEAVEMLRQFKVLDKTNTEQVLFWLMKFQPLADHIGVVKGERKWEVYQTLQKHGYIPNMNCNEAFDGEDKENVVLWIIGQAQSFLQKHRTIHPMLLHHGEQWKEKFNAVA